MNQRLAVTVLVSLVASLTTGPLAAQARLGPVDGDGLPPTDTARVVVGTLAPDFILGALNGPPVTLSQFRGAKNIILVFYRGHW